METNQPKDFMKELPFDWATLREEDKVRHAKALLEKEKGNWHFIGGDVSYLEHGGLFLFHRTGKYTQEKKLYYLLQFLPSQSWDSPESSARLLFCAPEAMSAKERKQVADSCDAHEAFDAAFLKGGRFSRKASEEDVHRVIEATVDYGNYVEVDTEAYALHSHQDDFDGNAELEELLEELRIFFWAEAESFKLGMSGFVLDKQVNYLGNTGFDRLAGNIGIKAKKKKKETKA